MATTMALEAQWRPRATRPSDTSSTDAPMPPKVSGTRAESRPSAFRASMVSAGEPSHDVDLVGRGPGHLLGDALHLPGHAL